MERIMIYTDGGYNIKQNIGAYAFAIVDKDHWEIKHSFSYAMQNQTNNRMEMLGVIKGLEFVKNNYPNANIVIYSDSQYVINGAINWRFGWINNGWKTKDGKDVENIDLWKELSELLYYYDNSIRFYWVRGHNGDIFNSYVDAMCTATMRNNNTNRSK